MGYVDQMQGVFIDGETATKLDELVEAMLDNRGREVNNPKPVCVPVGNRPLSIKEQIQRLVRGEVARHAQRQGYESFDEANDFDVDSDRGIEDTPTKYQVMEDEFLIEPEPGASGSGDTGGKKAVAVNEKKKKVKESAAPVEGDEDSEETSA